MCENYKRHNAIKAAIVIPLSNLRNNDTHIHTLTHPFNGHFSGTTRVSRYQKGKTNLDFTEARDSEWQWHQLGHMHYASLHLAPDRSISQSINVKFVGRRYTRRPGAPTVVSGTHDQKVHS